MPQNKFQSIVLTAIMAIVMVYGMVVYNVALNMGGVRNETFLYAIKELPIMVPVAFILEFFVVSKVARILAFKVVKPGDRPQIITYAISICICCIMCPIMSMVAMLFFNDIKSLGMWIQMWGLNLQLTLCFQLLYCGPFVRLIFRSIFKKEKFNN